MVKPCRWRWGVKRETSFRQSNSRLAGSNHAARSCTGSAWCDEQSIYGLGCAEWEATWVFKAQTEFGVLRWASRGCGVSKSIAIFNRTMRLLEAFSKAEKALNTEDISKLINQTQRSAQRTARQLHESGWLECKVYNNCALYSASEKTKKLFGGAKWLQHLQKFAQLYRI